MDDSLWNVWDWKYCTSFCLAKTSLRLALWPWNSTTPFVSASAGRCSKAEYFHMVSNFSFFQAGICEQEDPGLSHNAIVFLRMGSLVYLIVISEKKKPYLVDFPSYIHFVPDSSWGQKKFKSSSWGWQKLIRDAFASCFNWRQRVAHHAIGLSHGWFLL